VVRSDALGKLGPSFGIGAGCGVGVGVGILGGTCLANSGYSSASSMSAWTESAVGMVRHKLGSFCA
jgi:hypothetical protein